MKFSCSVQINAPIEIVNRIFNDESYLKEWQDGYQGAELLSGEAGTVGAVSKITFRQGKRLMELRETLQVVNLPYEKTGLYEHVHMTNTMQNLFEEQEGGSTLFTANVHYTKFNGLVPRIMAKLFPGLFKKQVQKWLNQFKALVERQ